MAKILVADDNSNVQRTVTSALANLGIEVIAVNNGEAAVRKISDLSPDLILADIFMPVRNGYEVCEYVKKDSRFAHVPVVLLAGAFDPFDEREAQRVGADGILKKPFIPPDPLITMVKTLLDRAESDRLVAMSIAKTPGTMQAQSGAAAPADPPPVAVFHAGPEISEDPSPQEVAPPVDRVAFGEGGRPVAFGALLGMSGTETSNPDTRVTDPVDDEQILTSERDATLGEPIFWRNDADDAAPEEEAAVYHPIERPTEPEIEVPTKFTEDVSGQQDDTRLRHDESPSAQPAQPLEFVREEQDDTSPSAVDSESIVLDPAAYTSLTVDPDRAPDLVANPIEWLAAAPAVPQDSPSEVIPSELSSDEKITDIPHPKESVEPPESAQSTTHIVPASSLHSTDEPTVPAAQDSVAHEALAPEAAIALYPSGPQIVAPEPVASEHSAPQPKSDPEDTVPSISGHNWTDLSETFPTSAEAVSEQKLESAAEHSFSLPPAGNAQAHTADSLPVAMPDPAMVEAVVQRVLDKMRPQVVEIITREFLRPIVQALVQREIEKQ